MKKFTEHKDTGNKTHKQFEAFKRRLNASKHAFWFELIHETKKFQLFLEWRKKLRTFKDQSLSLKKFIFDMRKTRKYHVPVALIRDSAINKILKDGSN
jgi:hypothetical protein